MIVIINYNAGNLRSVFNAFNEIGEKAIISSNINDIIKSDAIVIPGVGAFNQCMSSLREMDLINEITHQVIEKKKPYLGICLGMQFLADIGYEMGKNEGFGWIDGDVRLIKPIDSRFRVPHIGWNNINIRDKNSILFKDLPEDPCFYFLHSYNFYCTNADCITSTCYHGEIITSSVQKDNVFGVQFHPEKSQKNGFTLLKNFVKAI